MSTHLHAGPGAAQASPPAARRLAAGRWRDPRLAVGVVLVTGSVVLGSRVLASADDTTPVWSLSSDVVAGSLVPTDAVQVDDVRLDDANDAALYLQGDEPFPSDLVAAHDLVAGELVNRSDVRPPDERAGAELPVAVQDGHRPIDLTVGERVDVWVAPGQDGGSSQPAQRVLDSVDVIGVDATGGGIGGGSGAVVLLGLDRPDEGSMPDTMSAITSGTVVLVRVEG